MKILIADDHAIIRRGTKEILEKEIMDIDLEEAQNGNELMNLIRANTYDLVISDITMPGRSGLETLKQIKEEFPRLPVLILSMHPEDQYAIRVLRAGASGYLTKDSAPDELVKAVRLLANGKRYISVGVADKLAESVHQSSDKLPHELLSDREFEVFKKLALGLTVSQIAESISLNVNTVSTYRSRILEKLMLKNNAELMRYAIDHALV